jgi:hypothetical protein
MSSSRRYAKTFRKSSFEKVSILVLLSILTGLLTGGAVGLITGHSFSSPSMDSSASRHP